MGNLQYWVDGGSRSDYYVWFAFGDALQASAAGLPSGVQVCPSPDLLKVTSAVGSNGSDFSPDNIVASWDTGFTTTLSGTVDGNSATISQSVKTALAHRLGVGGYAPSRTAGSITIEFDRSALAAAGLVPYGWFVGTTTRNSDRTANGCTVASSSDSYTFSGETLRETGQGALTFVAPLVKVDDAKTVTYDANGGTVSPASARTVNGSVTLPTPTRSYYDFLGWYTAASGGTKVGDAGSTYSPSADVTIHAHWTGKTYTVSFDGAGGSVSPLSKAVKYGESYGELPVPVRAAVSWRFLGWYTQTGGQGALVTASSTVATGQNHTLYAAWEWVQSVVITFNPGAGSFSSTSDYFRTVFYGSSIGTLPTPTYANYTFQGWYTAATGGTQVTGNEIVGASTPTEFYAHWTGGPTRTLTLRDDANAYVSTRSVSEGTAYGTLPTPTRTGYTFAGWFTGTVSGSQVTAATTMGAADTTIYARWTPTSLTITFDANGGSAVSPSSRTALYGQQYGTLPKSKKTGKKFAGWWTASSGGTEITATTIATTTLTVYAHWRDPASVVW